MVIKTSFYAYGLNEQMNLITKDNAKVAFNYVILSYVELMFRKSNLALMIKKITFAGL